MDKMRIRGGRPLNGSVEIHGAKNAALPILIASLLTGKTSRFKRVPNLMDIRTTLKLLAHHGAKITPRLDAHEVDIDCASIPVLEAPYDLVKTMRASVLVLGPLLARFGQARVSLPGGCAIGARPINYHLAGLEKLGAEIKLEGGYVHAKAKRLKGARVAFEFPSVGATENILMAATLADGESILENCAREPEIADLAVALRSMGAVIEGEGSSIIRVQGKAELGACNHSVMGDRIEAGTFLAAGFATRGQVEVKGIKPEWLDAVLVKFEEAGARVTRSEDSIRLECTHRAKGVDVTTLPYPGFPTDMQAQFMAVLAVAEGASVISETIFENRFMHVSELARLGADITVRGSNAMIRGKEKLIGAPLMATDLRASASLVIAGLAAQGETLIDRIYHLDRGYEKMELRLRELGADIERVSHVG